MNHAKALAVTVAYDVYRECAEGKIWVGEWKVDEPVGFHRFREILAEQMLSYSPKNRRYPGDEKFRTSTQQHRRIRKKSSFSNATVGSARSNASTTSTGMTREDFIGAPPTRLCGDLSKLCDHYRSIKPIPNKGRKVCVVCGDNAYHLCMECRGPDGKLGVALHPFVKKEAPEDSCPCFLHHHNTSFYGLSKNDHRLNQNKRKADWSFPTSSDRRRHAKEVRRILRPLTTAAPSISGAGAVGPPVDPNAIINPTAAV